VKQNKKMKQQAKKKNGVKEEGKKCNNLMT
jgi:hypothetical protein